MTFPWKSTTISRMVKLLLEDDKPYVIKNGWNSELPTGLKNGGQLDFQVFFFQSPPYSNEKKSLTHNASMGR